LLVVLDENVPFDVGVAFAERGHEILSVANALTRGIADENIASFADVHAAVVVTWNRRDFRRLSSPFPLDNVMPFRRLSWIAFRCRESHGATRARRWLDAIELHLTLAQQRRDTRLMIDITETTFTVLG
jgi:hypothetical protein